jgi:hypothetical protein
VNNAKILAEKQPLTNAQAISKFLEPVHLAFLDVLVNRKLGPRDAEPCVRRVETGQRYLWGEIASHTSVIERG